MSELRALPSVDRLLQTREAADLIAQFGRPMTLQAVRKVLSDSRDKYSEGQNPPQQQALLDRVKETLDTWFTQLINPVINATGVVLHTNLGRAPLSRSALKAIQAQASGYCTLEFNLSNGQRGNRSVHTERLLQLLTGVEAALVVNNNAAAVLLVLSALANRRRTVVSRMQLVEIGGGFRIPDVMKQSGSRLVEVGTTNRVHINDYAEALEIPTAVVLRAHPSNFRVIGFTSEPTLEDICRLAHERGALVVDDLGSGALLDTTRFGLAHEPTVQESLSAGVDVVCISGDKLLGGPQAGIILGRADLVEKIKKHPLARAVRADKLCLAALSATLVHYLKDEVESEIPVWQMISRTPEELRERAANWCSAIGVGEVISGQSTVGGGSLPGEVLPTFVLALNVPQPNAFLARLRHMKPPVIARVWEDRVVLDPRTVQMDQDSALLVGLQNALKMKKPGGSGNLDGMI